jgi:hypothetical protein
MTKVVYNVAYGGFGLSKAAVLRYAELSGFTLEREPSSFSSNSDPDMFGTWQRDGQHWDDSDISRTDPILAQVVEELGDAANGDFSRLAIRELSPGTQYRMDEYDGMETVMTIDDYEWSVA